jgi:antitoxin CcdA
MREPPYDSKSAKQTVSVTLNSDLYAKAKGLGINVSKVAEEAIAQEYASRRSEQLRAELERELIAIEKYEEEHGSFSEMARAYFGEDDGAI